MINKQQLNEISHKNTPEEIKHTANEILEKCKERAMKGFFNYHHEFTKEEKEKINKCSDIQVLKKYLEYRGFSNIGYDSYMKYNLFLEW